MVFIILPLQKCFLLLSKLRLNSDFFMPRIRPLFKWFIKSSNKYKMNFYVNKMNFYCDKNTKKKYKILVDKTCTEFK
jgi:hypothetical protein